MVSSLLLSAATLVGLLAAVLTRSDRLSPGTWLNKPVLCLLHAVVMGLWVAAWLGVWRSVLRSLGGWRLAAGVAVTAAVMAEVIQLWWPGHVCDALGMGCNLFGAALAIVVSRTE